MTVLNVLTEVFKDHTIVIFLIVKIVHNFSFHRHSYIPAHCAK